MLLICSSHYLVPVATGVVGGTGFCSSHCQCYHRHGDDEET